MCEVGGSDDESQSEPIFGSDTLATGATVVPDIPSSCRDKIVHVGDSRRFAILRGRKIAYHFLHDGKLDQDRP